MGATLILDIEVSVISLPVRNTPYLGVVAELTCLGRDGHGSFGRGGTRDPILPPTSPTPHSRVPPKYGVWNYELELIALNSPDWNN